jgi:hypothetical protein
LTWLVGGLGGLADDRTFGWVECVVTVPVSVEELLDGRVALQINCLDRIYLNAYIPNLQVSGQVANFLTSHLGAPIAHPRCCNESVNGFRKDLKAFATAHDIPLLRFGKHDRKINLARPLLAAAERAQRLGVVAIGVA